MAAGAQMITKYMKAVGILAGSVHLDNPITNSIKTNPTLKRLLCEFDEIDIECLESLLKEKAVNGTYGLESVLNKFTSGKCTKRMPFSLVVSSLIINISLITFRPFLSPKRRFS